MLDTETVRRVDLYWTGFLRCASVQLYGTEPVVLSHSSELADYWGAYLLQRCGAAPVVSLPPSCLSVFGDELAMVAQGGLVAEARWDDILGQHLERTVGPWWVGYSVAESLYIPASRGTRLLTEEDASQLEQLRAACSADDLDNVASLTGAGVAVGAFLQGDLVAVAGYEIWGADIAHISVLTHPSYRGRGFARTAVRAIAGLALARGLIPQYRLLVANVPSRRIADSLGFEHYATGLALRFSTRAPGA
jgi:GNAT superfamily N-acetyltransferase